MDLPGLDPGGADQLVDVDRARPKSRHDQLAFVLVDVGQRLGRPDAFPSIGNRPITAIDGAVITDALSPIWTKKPETARRVKQRIERIIQWVRDGKPLPMQRASKRIRHHPAMAFAEAAYALRSVFLGQLLASS